MITWDEAMVEHKQLLAMRREEALKIDPETAEVSWSYPTLTARSPGEGPAF